MRQDAASTALTDRVPVQPPPQPTLRLPPAGGRRTGPKKGWRTVVIALSGLAMLFLIALLAGGRPDGRADASRPSSHRSSSPATQRPSPTGSATQEPSPAETSSPAVQQPSPVETDSPSLQQPSPEEAEAAVLDTVDEGIQTGEITGHLDHEIRHTIDEILREADKDEDVEESLEKVDDLREKVSEALEKGEINSPDRASAIDDALLVFAEALRDAEE